MIFEYVFRAAFDSAYTTIYAFLCAISFCLVYQVFFLKRVAKQQGVKLSFFHYLRVYTFLFYLLVVYRITGIGTLWDVGYYDSLIRASEIHLLPFNNIDFDLPFIVLNIIMTIPLGFLLPLIWSEFRSLKKIAFTGFCLSLIIELSQLLNRRATTVDDLLMNTLGAVLGCLLFIMLHSLFRPSKPFSPANRSKHWALKHEGFIYIALSFLGVFLLFNSNGGM